MNFDFSKFNVLVVGEVGIDEFVSGTSVRKSPEADVPVVSNLHKSVYAGMAGNLANQLTALGAQVRLLTVLGSAPIYEILPLVKSEMTYQYVNDRPLIRKTRVSVNGKPLARIDDESTHDLHPYDRRLFLESVLREIETGKYDTVFLQDYGKGLWDQESLQAVIQKDVPVFIDPFPGRPVMNYAGCHLIKPNLSEARRLVELKPEFDHPRDLVSQLRMYTRANHAVITLGASGCAYATTGVVDLVPAIPIQAVDVSGAGDTFMAVLGLSLMAGNTIQESLVLANKAGALVVQKPGTANVTSEELFNE